MQFPIKKITKTDNPISQQKVKVVCRVRPFLPHEFPDDTVGVDGNSIKITNQRNPSEILKYSFNACYGPTTTQTELFNNDVYPLLDHVLKGLNATIFAYGVTGSGKTHTMQGNQEHPGIIPRTLRRLFEIKNTSINRIDIKVSYMEIYKENVYDLLVPRDSITGLAIREDMNRNIFVANLTEKELNSYAEFEKVYAAACKHRSTAATKLNVHSSRSHAILCIYVTCRDDASGTTLFGKINLIDLAGSEDNRRTENGKERLVESAAINKSLFALGQVVEALSQGSSRIPYRDSKMTRILQDSLGGRSLSMIIINISPGQAFYTDTYNTLNFATRTREIENRPEVNQITDVRHVAEQLVVAKSQKTTRVFPSERSNAQSDRKKQRFSDPLSDKTLSLGNKRNTSTKNERLSDSIFVSTKNVEFHDFSSKSSHGCLAETFSARNAANPRALLSEKQLEEIEKKLTMKMEANLDEKLEKKIKEISGKQEFLSPVSQQKAIFEETLQERLEQRMETSIEPQLVQLLTPETKIKNGRALIALARMHEKQDELVPALEIYEKARVYLPEYARLATKISVLQEEIKTGKVTRYKASGQKRIGERLRKERSQGDKENKPYSRDSLTKDQPVMSNENWQLVKKSILEVINTADAKQIKSLKGIGNARARTIVEYINSHGPILEISSLEYAGVSGKVLSKLVKVAMRHAMLGASQMTVGPFHNRKSI
ncbi:10400_t:CDS:10 [Paraglomus occultum]|uniref:Kinesin-like protein n=1 Tax=Paraglomus occultum TaxID=144539 RepID=A0A9N8ZZS2_9GLOM|nr:10400_t:CDS:10 [Paraglomus occultum]